MMTAEASQSVEDHQSDVSLLEIWRAFGKIGFLSFGGPAGQIALMHRVIVDEKGWLTEQKYLNALSFCMMLPGPEAMQIATYVGWRLQGLFGGLIAGFLFVMPGAFVVIALATIYALFGTLPLIAALFIGVKAAVVVIVIEALLKVAKRALKRLDHWAVAALAFVALFFLALPFPLIIALAAAYGALSSRKQDNDNKPIDLPHISLASTLKTIASWLAIWWAPLLLLWLLMPESMLLEIGLFFSKLAVVTFGGAYAVLAYMAQDVVTGFGWLTAGEMMDGLGLAETTPGPLILVTNFVGFLAGFSNGGISLALAAALITLWVTFTPCFLWIFAGAPYVEWITAQPRLKGALSGITAAVVGVILNLSIWFALHVFFKDVALQNFGWLKLWVPDVLSLDWRVLVLSSLCVFLLFRLKQSVGVLLVFSALGGLLFQVSGLGDAL